MRWIITISFCISLALVQDAPSAPRAKWNGSDTAQAQYRKQGAEALAKEQARSKAKLCTEAERGGNARIARCLTDQAKETEQDYLAYIRAIGALLRLPAGAESARSPQKLPFDLAEKLGRRTVIEVAC